MNAPIPSMPGRSQRILLNKRNSAAPRATAARLYNKKRSANTALSGARTRVDHSSSLSSSIAGSSISNLTARRAPSAGIFSSFSNTVENDNPNRPAFGKKELRFDGQLELREYFNREPGPGTYTETTSTC